MNKVFKELSIREERTWGDVFWKHVRMGKPFDEAAFCADEWERRPKKRSLEARLNCPPLSSHGGQ